jgi:hypothetical protein
VTRPNRLPPPKTRPLESTLTIIVLDNGKAKKLPDSAEEAKRRHFVRGIARHLGPGARVEQLDQQRTVIYLPGGTARSAEPRVRALLNHLRERGEVGVAAGVLGVGPDDGRDGRALRTATRLARHALRAGPDGVLVADQLWTKDGRPAPRPHVAPSYRHGLLSRGFQVLVVAGAWVLFFWWWATVAAGVPARQVLVDAVIPVLGGLALIVLATVLWTAHNQRIARKGRRGLVARWAPPDRTRDALGRHIDAPTEEGLESSGGRASQEMQDALILRQQVDESAGIKRYTIERELRRASSATAIDSEVA